MSGNQWIPDRFTNLDRWNEVVEIHMKSELYRVDDVIAQKTPFSSVELDALGDTSHAVCLHPMCHIGTDTITLARMCKYVIGFDYAAQAVTAAQSLADKGACQNVQFTRAHINEFPVSDGVIDLIFLNWGSLAWIFDLDKLLTNITRALAPGGRLVIVDQHPIALSSRRGDQKGEPIVTIEPYIGQQFRTVVRGDYAHREAFVTNTRVVESRHTIGSLVSAITRKLRILNLKEMNVLGWPAYSTMRRIEDRLWIFDDCPIPLSFSLAAQKC